MKLTMSIDGISYTLNVSPSKTLNQILLEVSPFFPLNNRCLGANCGNCIVILNGECKLSCLVPACMLSGASVVTFEGFSKTRSYADIEKAYTVMGTQPCRQCYASKTLLIESLIQKMEKSKSRSSFSHDYIRRELSVSNCLCTDYYELEKTVKLAYQYRSMRSGRTV